MALSANDAISQIQEYMMDKTCRGKDAKCNDDIRQIGSKYIAKIQAEQFKPDYKPYVNDCIAEMQKADPPKSGGRSKKRGSKAKAKKSRSRSRSRSRSKSRK